LKTHGVIYYGCIIYEELVLPVNYCDVNLILKAFPAQLCPNL